MSIAERGQGGAWRTAAVRGLAPICALTVLASTALAQQRVAFSANPRDAVREARERGRPLMLYVVGRDWEDMEEAHDKSFRDPEVIAASRRFVPARLILSQHRELAAQWGLGKYAHDLVFTTPDGNLLDIAPSWVTARPQPLVEKMRLAFDRYREHVLLREVTPVLDKAEAGPEELRRALRRVEDLVILRADAPIAKLLQRGGLDDAVKSAAYAALAVLSTPTAVKALLREVKQSPAAAAALGTCTPAAADELLLPYLVDGDPELRLIVYQALTRICKIGDVKPEKFWKSENARAHRMEIDRVRRIVRRAADDWRKRNEYR